MSSRTTVAQLRDALRAKGLDATGNKAELLARLERASGPSEGATTTTTDNATTKTKRTRSPAGKTRAAAPTRSTRPLKRHAPALVLLLALTLLVSKVYFPNPALGVLATRAKPHLIRAMRLPMRVFGGADDNSRAQNDLYEFDFATSSWRALSPAGTLPTARKGHAACLLLNGSR